MSKTLGSFKLNVESGSFTNCEIVVLLGENGTGKTTLVRLLAGDKKCEPDEKEFDVNILCDKNKQYFPNNFFNEFKEFFANKVLIKLNKN